MAFRRHYGFPLMSEYYKHHARAGKRLLCSFPRGTVTGPANARYVAFRAAIYAHNSGFSDPLAAPAAAIYQFTRHQLTGLAHTRAEAGQGAVGTPLALFIVRILVPVDPAGLAVIADGNRLGVGLLQFLQRLRGPEPGRQRHRPGNYQAMLKKAAAIRFQ